MRLCHCVWKEIIRLSVFFYLKHYLDYFLVLLREAVAQHAPAKTLCIMYIYIGAIHSAIHSLAEILHSSMLLFKWQALLSHKKLIFPLIFLIDIFASLHQKSIRFKNRKQVDLAQTGSEQSSIDKNGLCNTMASLQNDHITASAQTEKLQSSRQRTQLLFYHSLLGKEKEKAHPETSVCAVFCASVLCVSAGNDTS